MTTSLKDHRVSKYNKMTAIAKAGLRPEGLTPSSGAATQHKLRAYLQYKDWLLLESMSIPPTDFGWRYWNEFAAGLVDPNISHELRSTMDLA